MLIDRTHRTWMLISLAILGISSASYAAYAWNAPYGPAGGSFMGLVYGLVGTGMMFFAGLLAARKKVPTWRIGSAQFWLRGHLWLGTLSIPMILFHSGFEWGGLVEVMLWICFIVVIATGFFGLAMQQFLPRLMTARVPLETFNAQVPYQCQRNQFLADKTVAEVCGPLAIEPDPSLPMYREVVKFYNSASREEKGDWINKVDRAQHDLLYALSKFCKLERWISKESDFPQLLIKIYAGVDESAGNGSPAKAGGAAAKLAAARAAGNSDAPAATAPADAAPKPMSKLEQARAASAAKEAGASPSPEKKVSKLDQARAAAAGAAPAAAAEKPMSKLEQIKAQAAAKAAGGAAPVAVAAPQPAAPSPAPPQQPAAASRGPGSDPAAVERQAEKIVDVLTGEYQYSESDARAVADRARQTLLHQGNGTDGELAAAAPPAKSPPAAAPAPSAAAASPGPAKPLSKLEQLKAQAAAKAAGGAVAAAAEEPPAGKPMSKLEQLKAQAAAKAAGGAAAPAGDKPMSKLEQLKAQAAAKAGTGESAAAKPASKLDQLKAQAAAKEGGSAKPVAAKEKPAAAEAKPTPKPAKPVAKKGGPAGPSEPIPRLDELKHFYLNEVRPFLEDGRASRSRLKIRVQSDRVFARMRADLPTELHGTLDQLNEFCEERRQFSTQRTIHRWMHSWLILHIPVTIALLVLFVAHVVMSLRVVPISLN